MTERLQRLRVTRDADRAGGAALHAVQLGFFAEKAAHEGVEFLYSFFEFSVEFLIKQFM